MTISGLWLPRLGNDSHNPEIVEVSTDRAGLAAYRNSNPAPRRTRLRACTPTGLSQEIRALLIVYPALAQGVPARVVMEILGRSQISVTLNTYAYIAPEISRDAANRVETALGG